MSLVNLEEKWKELFAELVEKIHSDQAKWFLNAFWDELSGEAENIWEITENIIRIDNRHEDGCDLDEFEAHRFLEILSDTLTVMELRKKLREIDIDENRRLALSEYLLFKYNKTPEELVNAPQGDNKDELDEAQNLLDEALESLENVKSQLEEQLISVSNHDIALLQQKESEAAVKKAESEASEAVNTLKAQEDDFNKQISNLESQKNNSNLSKLKQNTAAVQLSQLRNEDPLPLRKAKLTQEAALRKVEKERKACVLAVEQAEEVKKELEVASKSLADKQSIAKDKVIEAEKYLSEAKKRGGPTKGTIWWMERTLKEKQKYMPSKKNI